MQSFRVKISAFELKIKTRKIYIALFDDKTMVFSRDISLSAHSCTAYQLFDTKDFLSMKC